MRSAEMTLVRVTIKANNAKLDEIDPDFATCGRRLRKIFNPSDSGSYERKQTSWPAKWLSSLGLHFDASVLDVWTNAETSFHCNYWLSFKKVWFALLADVESDSLTLPTKYRGYSLTKESISQFFFNLLHRIFVYQSMILIVVRYSFVSCLKWMPKFLLYILHFLKGTDAVMGDDKVAEQTWEEWMAGFASVSAWRCNSRDEHWGTPI